MLCTNVVELTVKSTKYFWLFSPTQLFTLPKTKRKCDWAHVYLKFPLHTGTRSVYSLTVYM